MKVPWGQSWKVLIDQIINHYNSSFIVPLNIEREPLKGQPEIMFNNNKVIILKVYSTWECAEYGKYYLWFTDDDAQIK